MARGGTTQPESESAGARRGRVLVVGTPIGNLGDLSPRAAAALRESDLVVAEDTRVAAKVLAAIGARTATTSFNDHNARERLPGLLAHLARGETLALTTDAGMPAVSDPGAELVAAARDAGASIEVVPGPSAVTAAVAVSGIGARGFVFAGYLPARPAAARGAALERARSAAVRAGTPLVLFESTHRIRALLRELADTAPHAHVVVCRELTKMHEEVVVGSAGDVAEDLSDDRGEFVVMVDERGAASVAAPVGGRLDAVPVAEAARAIGLADRTIVDLLRAGGMPRRDAYRLVSDGQSGRNGAVRPP
ncbi:MAG: 16S rRNA (cytidine(1402)-2'-O)-methyltransferase [Candidatus Limnocylindria bacterium]